MPNIFTPQQLTFEEVEQLDKQLWLSEGNWEEMDKTWLHLHEFFSDNNPEKERLYFCTYFRWYAELCWHMKEIFGKEHLAQNIFGRLFTVGILLDYDPRKELFFFLNSFSSDVNEMRSIYLKCREALFASDSLVGYWQNQPVTVVDLVREIRILNAQNYDSLKVAEFKEKLKNILFSRKDKYKEFEDYFIVDQDMAMIRFLDMVNLFLGVSDDKIYFLVDSYLNPWKYGLLNSNISEDVTTEEVISTPEAEAPALPPLDFNKTRGELSKIQDPERVLMELQELSNQYNDPDILSWYYFDEQTGEFKWRE